MGMCEIKKWFVGQVYQQGGSTPYFIRKVYLPSHGKTTPTHFPASLVGL